MNQGDCRRVQAVEIELEKACRGALPAAPAQLAALLAGPEPLPIRLAAGDRASIASHLSSCALCQQFWAEQRQLGTLLQEAAFDLPAGADELELRRLENRIVHQLIEDHAPRNERQPARNQGFQSEQEQPGHGVRGSKRPARLPWREANVSRHSRKYWLVAAAALVAAVGVVYFSYFYPPVVQDDVQGAIGKRDVYRETNVTEKDVKVAAGPAFTFDGARQFMNSPEFKKMKDDPSFKKMVSNQADFASLISNPSFAGLVSGTQSLGNASQLLNGLGQLASFASKNETAFLQMCASPEFQSAILNCGSYASLVENKTMAGLFETHPGMQSLVMQSQEFKNAINNPAALNYLQQNSGDLSSFAGMITNGAFGLILSNPAGANALFSNPAFAGMVSNESFVLANQLGTLQNNSAFNSLINSTQFYGCLNDPNFQALAGNNLFQAFLNGAAQHQLNASKPLDNASLGSLANQTQYASLAGNANFTNLMSNGNLLNFLNHPSFPVLQTQYNLGSLVLNEQVLANVHSLADMNGMISQASNINSTMFGVVF